MKLRDAATLDLPELLHELVSQTATQMLAAICDGETTVAEVEERVLELSREMAREVFSTGLSERFGKHQGPRRPCDCGEDQRFLGYRARNVMTLLGQVRYTRAYYRCSACRAVHYAGDDEIGAGQCGCSIPAQEAIALVSCELPFESARNLLVRFTALDMSVSLARLVTEEHGAHLEQEALAEREALFRGELELLPEGSPKRLYVTMDGLQMLFLDDWHEAKTGAVYEARPGKDGIDEPFATTYVCGAWEGPEEFGKRLYQEAARRGVERAAEVVALGDGAPWIWNLALEHFAGAVQILDWYHAVERLHVVGRAVYGEGTAKARKFAEANKGRLWEGRVNSVLRSLRALRPPTGEGREAVRQAIGYFGTNRGRMDYPSYRARGYQVGSGVVEAACKTVAKARCKRSGMRWSKAGAQSVLNLRCLRLSGRWDAHWKPLKAAA